MNAITHSPDLLTEHPTLQVVVLDVAGYLTSMKLDRDVEQLLQRARHRLSVAPESQWPAVQAWRAAFAAMGLTPTKYRSASEALLRRIRTQDVFSRVHPLIDLCNAASAAHGVPIAVLDADKIAGTISVTHARGDERYEPFAGDVEYPAAGEVTNRDDQGWAHARRWCYRSRAAPRSHPAQPAPSSSPRPCMQKQLQICRIWPKTIAGHSGKPG